MSDHPRDNRQPPSPELAVIIGALLAIGLVIAAEVVRQLPWSAPAHLATGQAGVEVARISSPTATIPVTRSKTPTPTPTPTFTSTSTLTPPPTHTPPPTVTPTPTLDLAKCNAAGCGLQAKELPTVEYDYNVLLTYETPTRRVCEDCPKNEQLSGVELNNLVAANSATLARLQTIALSQKTHQIAPGIVYIVFENMHHVVIDLQESGYVLRNIIPDVERGTLITPSYCLSPKSLVVIDADYHALDGSNKTETGRDLFFHMGRAALFQRDGRFDIDLIREREDYDATTISWGGGPIFIWNGQYNFNPKQEWFTLDNLEYYRETRWAKITVALSRDRKYLFITASFGSTLEEHAENIISLGEKWGIKVDRAMKFDGGEGAYLAIRLNDYMVPVLNIEEPLIVNCLAVEKVE